MTIDLKTHVSFVVAGKPYSLTRGEIVSALSCRTPEDIFEYWVEIDGKEWPVKQVLSLATGLANTGFNSTRAQRLLKKLGFEVKSTVKRKRARAATQSLRKQSTRPKQSGPFPAPDIVLISCSKRKLDHAAPARQLYSSPYFNFMRDYAEGRKHPWFILSAKHGLVSPETPLEPYDEYLPKKKVEERRRWGARVAEQLEKELGSLSGKVVEIHAGKAYVRAVESSLKERGVNLTEPLKGLGMGYRLAWYRARRSSPEDVTRLVKELGDESRRVSVDEFLTSSDASFDLPGIYAWWIDSVGAAELSVGFGPDEKLDSGLLYAGLAGATRTNGKSSKNTLRKRIATMHLGKRHTFSTLRWSVGSILAEAHEAAFIDEARLSEWMREHLQVIAVPFTDVETLGQIESAILSKLDPPLNLAKVSRKVPRRVRLSALRKKYYATKQIE